MKTCVLFSTCIFVLLGRTQAQTVISNPQIDFPAFLKNAERAGAIREPRRLSEEQFLKMMGEPGVVLLDARSAKAFQLRHLKGAVNLSLPDFTAAELAKIIPGKDTKVLIYCNNNFRGSSNSFPTKAPAASLNITTFINLNTYGYTNIYELGPNINTQTSMLPFEGDEVSHR